MTQIRISLTFQFFLLYLDLTRKAYDEDIERTFGGLESSRSYYSSVYSR